MERTASDDMAVAGLPSTSGAHWANRDNDVEFRKAGERSTPFRRPPALHSFPDDQDRSAYRPADAPEVPATSWFAAPESARQSGYPRQPEFREAAEPAAPEFGPAPPATPGRVSFGVTAGPISPNRAPAPSEAGRGDGEDRGYDFAGPAFRGQDSAGSPAVPDEVLTDVAAVDVSPPSSPASGYRDGDHVPGVGEITGPGREIRPHRASRSAHDHTPPHGISQLSAEPPRRSRRFAVATALLAVLVLLGGTVAGLAFFSDSGSGISSVLRLGAGKTGGRTVTAPLDGRRSASFELVAATTRATVKTADLGRDLYRITTAHDSGVVPDAVLSGGKVQLHLTPDGDGASGTVDVVLSAKVRWSLRFTAAADEQIVNLTGGRVAAIDVVGGVRRFQLVLPKPAGTVPVRVNGAIEDFSIQSPVGSPVRVRLDSGAKTVAAGERTLRDVAPDSTFTPRGWGVKDRYDVEAAARVTLLSVTKAG